MNRVAFGKKIRPLFLLFILSSVSSFSAAAKTLAQSSLQIYPELQNSLNLLTSTGVGYVPSPYVVAVSDVNELVAISDILGRDGQEPFEIEVPWLTDYAATVARFVNQHVKDEERPLNAQLKLWITNQRSEIANFTFRPDGNSLSFGHRMDEKRGITHDMHVHNEGLLYLRVVNTLPCSLPGAQEYGTLFDATGLLTPEDYDPIKTDKAEVNRQALRRAEHDHLLFLNTGNRVKFAESRGRNFETHPFKATTHAASGLMGPRVFLLMEFQNSRQP